MLSSKVKFSADRQTPVKQYALNLSMRGHDNIVPRTKAREKSGFFLNPFPNKPWFLRVCSTNFLETL